MRRQASSSQDANNPWTAAYGLWIKYEWRVHPDQEADPLGVPLLAHRPPDEPPTLALHNARDVTAAERTA